MTLPAGAATNRALRGLVAAAALTMIAGVLATAASFWISGGRWFIVRTPSMGTAAPVGTLVLTRPVAVRQLHVGDIIAFHPPTDRSETFTHRVTSLRSGVHTRGDINGASDPWTLRQADLVGRARHVVPGLGWLLRALPLLVVGGLLLWGLTSTWLRREWRGPVRMLGAAVVVTVTSAVLRPFAGVVQLASTTTPDGVTRMSLVSTGLLPLRVAPRDGGRGGVELDHAGATGVAVLRAHEARGAGGAVQLISSIHLDPAQWVLVIAVSLVPLLWNLAVGFEGVPQGRHRPSSLSAPHRVPVPA